MLAKLIVAAILTSLLGCKTNDPASLLKENIVSPNAEDPTWVFLKPNCLPACKSADKEDLLNLGYAESLIVKAIDQATQEVEFSMYTFSRKPIFEALVRAVERGVFVKGIVDKGQFRSLREHCDPASGCAPPPPFDSSEYRDLNIRQRLHFASGQSLFTESSNTEKLAILFAGTPSSVRPAPGSSRLVHNKFVMIDNRLLVNGSGNWSSTAVSINLENLGILTAETHPEELSAFVCAFDVLWRGDPNYLLNALRGCESESIRFSPAASRGDNPLKLITSEIEATQTSIRISMHHLTHNDVYRALEEALARGVSVQLLHDDDDCNAWQEPGLRVLISRGAQVRYMPTACELFQLSHNKFGIFDDKIVINGSGNWSKAGLTRNYENFIRFAQQSDVTPFASFFDKAWSQAVTIEQCRCPAGDLACGTRYCRNRRNP